MAYTPGVQPGSGKSNITFRHRDGTTTISRAGKPTVTIPAGQPVPEANAPQPTPDKVTLITPRTGPNAGNTSLYQGLPGQGGQLLAQGTGVPKGVVVDGVSKTSEGYKVDYTEPGSSIPVVGIRPGSYDGNINKQVSQSPLIREGYTYDPSTGNVQATQYTPQNSNNSSMDLGLLRSSSFPNGNGNNLNLTAPRTQSAQETINREITPNELLGIPNYTEYPKNISTAFAPSGEFNEAAQSYSRNYSLENFNINTQALKAFERKDVLGVSGGIALGALGFAQGAGEAIVRTPEFFSPVTYEGKLQVPVIQPLAETADSLVTNPGQVLENPFSTAGNLFGSFLGGKIITQIVYFPKRVQNARTFQRATGQPATGYVENPAFASREGFYPVELIFPASKEFYYTPTEYTELGRGFKQVAKQPIDSTAGETLPGTYLEISQNFPLAEGLKKTPEYQTRLATSKPTARGISQLTPLELLEQTRKSLGTTQTKVGDVESQAVKPRLNLFPDKKGSATLINPENIARDTQIAYDYIKGKYRTYRELSREPQVPSGSQSTSIPRVFPIVIRDSAKTNVTTNLPIRVFKSPISSGSFTINEVKAKQIQRSQVIPFVETATGQEQSQSSGQRQSQSISPVQIQVQEQSQAQSQIQLQEQVPRQQGETKPFFEVPKENLPLNLKTRRKENKNKKFISKVRSKGKFETKGVFDTLEKAFSKGFSEVKNTAAASFKVEEQGRGTVQLPALGQFSDQIYKSKKEKGVLIQRREKRISTRGEKEQITFKGIQANKLRSGFNKSNMGGLRL